MCVFRVRWQYGYLAAALHITKIRAQRRKLAWQLLLKFSHKKTTGTPSCEEIPVVESFTLQ